MSSWMNKLSSCGKGAVMFKVYHSQGTPVAIRVIALSESHAEGARTAAVVIGAVSICAALNSLNVLFDGFSRLRRVQIRNS